jgi:hypothetical protein
MYVFLVENVYDEETDIYEKKFFFFMSKGGRIDYPYPRI